MSISTETPFASFTANGVADTFAYSFTILDAGDLVVTGTLDGLLTTYTFGADYTLTGVGSASGSVVFLDPPANGTIIRARRDISLQRATNYQENGDLLAATVNRDFDRIWMALQDQSSANDRTLLRVPADETVTDVDDATARANKALGFDANGNPVLLLPEAHVLSTQAPETGGVVELVNVWIQRERLMPQQVGCVADNGASDQTVNLQRAINAAASRKMPLNLNGRRWKANGGLLIPTAGVEWENGEIYMPGVSSGAYGVTTAGALGVSLSLSSAVARGADVLPMSSVLGLVEGQWYRLSSADLWADNGSGVTVTLGEWVRIRSIAGLNVRLYRPILDAYTTSPVLHSVSWVDHIYLTDVRLTGGGAGLGQNGAFLSHSKDTRIYNTEARSVAARGMAYDHCLDIEIDGGTPGDGDDSTGLSYGHIIAGPTLRARSRSVRGDGLRHVVTAGGSAGVVRGYRCDGVTGTAMTDATVDAHPAVDDAVFMDIRHEGDTYTDGVSAMGSDGDGIVSQALTTHIDGYVIRRPGRHGILIQPACKVYKGRAKVGQGEIRDHGAYSSATGWAINFAIDYNASQGLTLASVDGADIESAEAYANGIQIAATSGGVAHGQIGARVTTQGRAVLARGDGQTIANLQLLGGYYERTNTTAETVMLWGTASGQVTQAKVLGAYVKGGTYGVRGLNATSCNVSNNTIKSYSLGAVNGITHNGTTDFVVNNET